MNATRNITLEQARADYPNEKWFLYFGKKCMTKFHESPKFQEMKKQMPKQVYFFFENGEMIFISARARRKYVFAHPGGPMTRIGVIY